MTAQFNLNINQLREFAPNSPILAFRPIDTGSPQQDWSKHLAAFPHYRRELEEFSILGDVVLRIANGTEPAPIERVKILSLEYAIRVLGDETDAKEFIRSIIAIASPDASQYELEQIAAYYFGETRRRTASEVLKEMGLLGMQLEAVTATINDREIGFAEAEIGEQKLSVSEQRMLRIRQRNLPRLADPTPNYNDEMTAIFSKIGRSKVTKSLNDDFAEFYLSDDGKTIEELDSDFETFEKLEQYDENGVVGFSMNDGQHSVVVYDFSSEVDATYLPSHVRSLANEMNLIFVGHKIGGIVAQKARQFIIERRNPGNQSIGNNGFSSTDTLPLNDAHISLPATPFSEHEFNEWLAAKVDCIYPNRVKRDVRRFITNKAGITVEYQTIQEINPDFEEAQYVMSVCKILWNQMLSDFHMRSLRHEAYQSLHLAIRKTVDTADVAKLKKQAFDDFKEQKTLSLKEFTSLNTAAKSQEARLSGIISPVARKTLSDIKFATLNRLRYFKYFLYNDHEIQILPRQEKQKLWDAIRSREAELNFAIASPKTQNVSIHPSVFQRQTSVQKQVVRVYPRQV